MHWVEHLAGMNCVHPQINQIRTKFDKFVCNRTGRCLHSITLASLTLFRTPASTIRSEWRRSAARDRAPEHARHGRQVAVVWHRHGFPTPCPPSLPRRPCLPSTAPRPLDTGFGRPGPPTPVLGHARRRPSHHSARAKRPPRRARTTPPRAPPAH